MTARRCLFTASVLAFFLASTASGNATEEGEPLDLLAMAMAAEPSGIFGQATPMDEEALAGQRGGFSLADTGIMRFAVDIFGEIDGTPVIDASLTYDGTALTSNIADLGDPRGSLSVSGLTKFSGMIANGNGNTRPTSLGGSQSMFTVIQNVESNVQIRQITSMMLELKPGTIQSARTARTMPSFGRP